VRKRRSLQRLLEIITILSGQVFRPLLCSLAKTGPQLALTEDWDAFWSWSQKTIRGQTLSNAQRVAQGFQQLGPTFVKLGQMLATRPDILHVPLADALANLQDSMLPFDNLTAKRMIRRDLRVVTQRNPGRYLTTETSLKQFMDSLSAQPVAAASIAQVYKGTVLGYGDVAVKVQRPGIRKKVERDATLFHSLAAWIESLQWPDGEPLVRSMQIVRTTDQLMANVLEHMDFAHEAENMQLFSQMYSHKRGSSPTVQVVVPELLPELCSGRVLIMEWIEGTKLTDICAGCDDRGVEVAENLALIKKAIECTLSQLLDTGLLHADPHTGNLLKVRTQDGEIELGYLDFGLVSFVPQRVRDGIVCAVVQLVFARNIEAVADLFVDLELLPEEKLKDPRERKRLVFALKRAFNDILLWPKDKKGRSTAVPKVRFENLLASLASLVANFEFTVPSYFLNNARALATLEGIALKLDPDFNILRVIYPYSINRLMRNPSVSEKVEETFLDICRSPETKLFDSNRSMMLLNDWSLLTGFRKRKIFWDLMTSAGGRRVMSRIMREWFLKRFRKVQAWYRVHAGHAGDQIAD
jgi:predicted unusual protein kinase regulating ubiquinone biosynthesis (AarF/ABC1/UbiB family)